MKQNLIALWILALFLVVYVFWAGSCMVAFKPSQREARMICERIAKSDHKLLLDACREMMVKRKHYRYITDEDFMTFGPECELYSNDVPDIIRSMTPIRVDVSKRQVHVLLCIPPRTGFVGYADDSDRPQLAQAGHYTFLTNGLWMFTE